MARRRIVVVGAGMAGLSCAAQLAERHDVTVLEAEDAPGYHSSGRSAASYIEPYLNPVVCALTQASRAFFDQPPDGFAAAPLLRPRTGLAIATAERAAQIDDYLNRWAGLCPALTEIEPAAALARVPILRREAVQRAALDPQVFDIDVHGLLQGFIRMLRARGGSVVAASRVTAATRRDGVWHIAADGSTHRADVMIDAAGAWGDEVARLAGAAPRGLVPKRRTALLVDCPGFAVADWPIVHEIDNAFYFKPDAGRLLLSPADQTPTVPCDAQPDELDVAIAAERFEGATTQRVRRIEHRWAGLRSFVADQVPVVGYDSGAPGFFWLIGQGGFGIQTAPCMGRVAATLVDADELPDDLTARGLRAATFAPGRPL